MPRARPKKFTKNLNMRIEPESHMYEIKYPEIESEFEVQAFLYSELKKKGIDARGEVQTHGAFGLRPSKASCRFDVVVFENKKAILILEIKARKVRHKNGVENTRQGMRYPNFGVPVQFIYGMSDAIDFLESFA